LPLFLPGCDPRADLRALATCVQRALREATADGARDCLVDAADGPAWRMVPYLRAGALPPIALELAAAAAGLASEDARCVRHVWHAHEALRMGAAPELKDDQPATAADRLPILLRKLEQFEAPADVTARAVANALAADEAQLAKRRANIRELRSQLERAIAMGGDEVRTRAYFEGAIEAELREAARLTNMPLGPSAGEPLERAGQHVLAIGAFDDGAWGRFPDDRPLLAYEREVFFTGDGLTLAVDAVLGGSHDALEKLHAFATTNDARAWAHWLDEMACVASGDGRRLAARRAALDACVAADPLAQDLVREARARVAASDTARFEDAWLAQSGHKPAHELVPPTFIEKDDPQAKELAGQLTDALASLPAVVEEMFGPFPMGETEPPPAAAVLLPAAHALLAGTRRLMGLDFAREALPRVMAWLDAAEVSPQTPTATA
jgi:hypothetical protein